VGPLNKSKAKSVARLTVPVTSSALAEGAESKPEATTAVTDKAETSIIGNEVVENQGRTSFVAGMSAFHSVA
jgi:hypothetical protein